MALQPGQRRRRVGILAIFAILLMLGAFTCVDLWSGRRVKTEVARLEARHGRLDEAGLLVPPIPDADNRARIVRAAAVRTVPAAADVKSSLSRYASQSASSPIPADLRTFVEANRPALRIAGDTLAQRQSNWDVDYRSGRDTLPLMEIETLSLATYLASQLDLEAERPDDASLTIASGLAVSASLRQEPSFVAQLIRLAVATRQLDAIRRLLIEAEPSKTSLEALARWLAENRMQGPMLLGLRGELTQGHTFYLQAAKSPAERTIGQPVRRAFGTVPLLWYRVRTRLERPMVRLAHARYLRRMGHLLEMQAAAPPRPALQRTMAPPRWALIERLANLSTPGIERGIESAEYFTSNLGGAEIAIALRRFRLDHDVYPDNLAALAPVYLSPLPIDAYTGRPPVYTRKGAGFTLQLERPRPEVAAYPAPEWNVEK